ncbi:MAG: hypothetical protein LBT58_02815 [Endomicrobium sp.]|jgi:NADH:ubiquinone oxidoreductase subunit|nr:hypothetical protein [Endomicrobium sp.]
MNNAVVKPDYDFSKVKSIRVGQFSSGKRYRGVGDAVQNAFIQNLLANGYDVVSEAKVKADCIIEGSVTSFYRVREERIDNVYYHGRSGIYSRRRNRWRSMPYDAMAYNNTVNIGVSARMTDVETDRVVWSDSFNNESWDEDSAISGAVKSVLKSLPKEKVSDKK